MKIRHGFVSNSSACSFILKLFVPAYEVNRWLHEDCWDDKQVLESLDAGNYRTALEILNGSSLGLDFQDNGNGVVIEASTTMFNDTRDMPSIISRLIKLAAMNHAGFILEKENL